MDTNVLIDVVRGRSPALADRLGRESPDDLVVSSITIAELWYGVARSSEPTRKRELWSKFLQPYSVLPFDRAAAEIHGELRHTLRRQPIGERDLLIAATALANDLVVVTGNTREFVRVSGLTVENWAAVD